MLMARTKAMVLWIPARRAKSLAVISMSSRWINTMPIAQTHERRIIMFRSLDITIFMVLPCDVGAYFTDYNRFT
jgi:hypothetical protein